MAIVVAFDGIGADDCYVTDFLDDPALVVKTGVSGQAPVRPIASAFEG